ncbi:DinB family protein [Flavobacteriaceae bacterium S356]|uniref:DinB family protein n=1 Tax=Asprobacillus argus TaxID=3076534 RepID=A0ABU3LAV9_9FLAO|nr:DinB family protein [Flavobacteriaceae bacterium S356]
MKTQISVLKKSREITLKAIQGLTLEQLHKIPTGFKNNIAWNVAHLVVTQQLLNYDLSGLNCLVSDELIAGYRKGTFPEKEFTEEEFEEIKELLIGLPNTLEEDYDAGIFKKYKEYQSSTGYIMNSIESAISFNNFHEGIHLGIIMSLKKLV